MKQTLESIGCLVSSDNQAGNFQSSDDVSDLLFTIVNQLENIKGLVHAGSSADHRLKKPELYRESDTFKAVK